MTKRIVGSSFDAANLRLGEATVTAAATSTRWTRTWTTPSHLTTSSVGSTRTTGETYLLLSDPGP